MAIITINKPKIQDYIIFNRNSYNVGTCYMYYNGIPSNISKFSFTGSIKILNILIKTSNSVNDYTIKILDKNDNVLITEHIINNSSFTKEYNISLINNDIKCLIEKNSGTIEYPIVFLGISY